MNKFSPEIKKKNGLLVGLRVIISQDPEKPNNLKSSVWIEIPLWLLTDTSCFCYHNVPFTAAFPTKELSRKTVSTKKNKQRSFSAELVLSLMWSVAFCKADMRSLMASLLLLVFGMGKCIY